MRPVRRGRPFHTVACPARLTELGRMQASRVSMPKAHDERPRSGRCGPTACLPAAALRRNSFAFKPLERRRSLCKDPSIGVIVDDPPKLHFDDRAARNKRQAA